MPAAAWLRALRAGWRRSDQDCAIGLRFAGATVHVVARTRRGYLARSLPAGDLEAFVRAHARRGMSARIALAPEHYRLLMVDVPDVPEADRAEALRWQIADQLDFPAERAVIDVATVPQVGPRRRAAKLHVASADREALAGLVARTEALGLRVERIDIAEFALARLANRPDPAAGQAGPRVDPDDAGGSGGRARDGVAELVLDLPDPVPDTVAEPATGTAALLWIEPAGGTIAACVDGDVLLARRLDGRFLVQDSPLAARDQAIDQLTLQVQRTLDFMESQLAVPAAAVWVAAPGIDLVPVLAEAVAVPVRAMHELPALAGRHDCDLLAYSAALAPAAPSRAVERAA